MTEIPTALEFYRTQTGIQKAWSIEMVIKEFAKLHVKAALEAALDDVKVKIHSFREASVYKDSILNAYPSENIK